MKGKKMNNSAERKGSKEIKSKGVEEKQISKRIFIGASVDGELWRRLRVVSIKQGTTAGPMLDKAIEEYLAKNEIKVSN
jgi:hypothetical protein